MTANFSAIRIHFNKQAIPSLYSCMQFYGMLQTVVESIPVCLNSAQKRLAAKVFKNQSKPAPLQEICFLQANFTTKLTDSLNGFSTSPINKL
jgi:hypothetical protein